MSFKSKIEKIYFKKFMKDVGRLWPHMMFNLDFVFI